MKKVFLLILLIILTEQIQAQKFDFDDKYETKYGMIVKISPFMMMNGNVSSTGEYGISLEHKIGLKTSIEGSAAFVGKSLMYMMLEDELYDPGEPRLTMNGYRVQADYRFYLTKKHAPAGLFVAPHFSFTNVKFSDDANKQAGNYILVNHFDYSIIGGYQFMLKRITLELHIGVTYRQKKWVEKFSQNVTILDEQEIEDFYMWPYPVKPKLGIVIGFAL